MNRLARFAIAWMLIAGLPGVVVADGEAPDKPAKLEVPADQAAALPEKDAPHDENPQPDQTAPRGENPPDAEQAKVQLTSGSKPAADENKPAEAPKPVPTEAERIARLERSLESDQKRFDELNHSITAPSGEFVQAETDFRQLDAEKNELKQKLAAAQEADNKEEVAKLEEDLASLEKKWTLAKERFDLAIKGRKAAKESVATLQEKLCRDRETLAKLKGTHEPKQDPLPSEAPPAEVQTPEPAPQPVAAAAPSAAPPVETPATAALAAATPVAPQPEPQAAAPPAPAEGTAQPEPAAAETSHFKLALTEKTKAQLAAAEEAARKSLDAAAAAEAEAKLIRDRIEFLQKDIGLERERRNTFRKMVDNADETLKSLNAEMFRKLMAGENIDGVRQQIDEATARLSDNRAQARQIATHLDELQSALALLQADQITASAEALKLREAALEDQAAADKLRNPFTLQNVTQWLIDHGPRILIILTVVSAILWLGRVSKSRLVDLLARRGRRGSREDRENRAKTMLSVFHNVANLLLITGGFVMVLEEIGISVTPLIGGAAVLGLAVAFGAQSLIKDYFTGFMVLMEQQYLINDVVRIGDITGQVERISLRMTVLRDLEGKVHFIPHGQINTVTNLTHGWSRAVFEIGVAYKESVDRVIELLNKLAADLRRDDGFRLLILDDPVMLGVDAFGDSAVVIKFYIQTRPLQQWTVKREMLRRIKNEFDRQGIEIPFPHVTVYQGAAQAAAGKSGSGSDSWDTRDVA